MEGRAKKNDLTASQLLIIKGSLEAVYVCGEDLHQAYYPKKVYYTVKLLCTVMPHLKLVVCWLSVQKQCAKSLLCTSE